MTVYSSAHALSSINISLTFANCYSSHSVAQQLNEMDLVRQKVYQLEQTQIAIKQK